MRSIDTTIDFDVELAKPKSDQNIVFYAHYANARCASILRKAVEEKIDIETKEKSPAFMKEDELDELLKTHKISKLYENDEKANSANKT